jgi:hypothetical protein
MPTDLKRLAQDLTAKERAAVIDAVIPGWTGPPPARDPSPPVYPLPLHSHDPLDPGASRDLLVNAQMAFTPVALAINGDRARWTIEEIFIGHQSVGQDVLPLNGAWCDPEKPLGLDLPPVKLGQSFKLVIHHDAPEPIPFQALLHVHAYGHRYDPPFTPDEE